MYVRSGDFLMFTVLPKLFSMSVMAGITIMAVILVRFVLRKAPKIFSYVLWSIVLFRLLCPISFSSPFSVFNMKSEMVGTVQTDMHVNEETDFIAEWKNHNLQNAHAVDQILVSQSNQEQKPQVFNHGKSEGANKTAERNVLPIVTAIWLIGMFSILGANIISMIRIKKKLAACFGIRENIFISDQIDTPFCMGVIRPKIYLPSKIGEAEREYIILHEQHHIQRMDHLAKLLAFVALALHWFNPLVWIAFALAGKDMEMSCDEAVLREMERMERDIRADYSMSLLQLATGRRLFMSSPISFGGGNPKQRIVNIMNYKKAGLCVIVVSILICVFTGICFISNPKAENESITEEVQNRKYIKSNADFYGKYLLAGQDKTIALDLDSLEKTTFCNKPNCSHNNFSCLSNVVKGNPVIYKDYAYYFTSSCEVVEEQEKRKLVISSKLMRASLSSFETELVCEFDDCAPNEPEYYVLDGNILYFTGNNLNPTEDEYGGLSYSNAGGKHYLCCIDLDTAKYTNLGSIYDGDEAYKMADCSSGANITGIYKDKMYIQYVFMKESPEQLGLSAEESWTKINFEYDFYKKELTESNLPAAIYADNDTYVYPDYEAKETIVIDQDVTYHIPYCDLIHRNAIAVNGKLFFFEVWFDLSDMTQHSYGKYEGYTVVCYHNDFYILVKGGDAVKLTEDELIGMDKEG